MRHLQVSLLAMLLAGNAVASTVYRCETPDGPVFSGQPCAEDAETVDVVRPGGPMSARATASNLGPVEAERFDELRDLNAESLVEQVGAPAATYTSDGIEHWFYPNGCRDGTCARVLLRDDAVFQVSWEPGEQIRRSVAIVRDFRNWRQPETPRAKGWNLAGQGDVRGLDKLALTTRLGQPDAKRAFRGLEVWEYRQVRRRPGASPNATLFVEFDGDEVANTSTD